MLYDPDWLTIAEAWLRLTERGEDQAEAEAAICLALAERKLRLAWTIERVIYAPTGGTLDLRHVQAMEFRDGNKLRLSVPSNLKPADIDWDNSRPLGPWPYRPWQYQLLAHVRELKIWRAHFERVFPAPAVAPQVDEAGERSTEAEGATVNSLDEPVAAKALNNSAGHAIPRFWAKRALDELYPDGVPDHVTNDALISAVETLAKAKGWKVGKRDTILRAAGRRRK